MLAFGFANAVPLKSSTAVTSLLPVVDPPAMVGCFGPKPANSSASTGVGCCGPTPANSSGCHCGHKAANST